MKTAALLIACAMLSACTFAAYRAPDGARVTILDFRLSANAIEFEASKSPDGSANITARRRQENPADSIDAAGDAIGAVVNPVGGLIP